MVRFTGTDPFFVRYRSEWVSEFIGIRKRLLQEDRRAWREFEELKKKLARQ